MMLLRTYLITKLHILSYIKVVIIHVLSINPVPKKKIHSLLTNSVPTKSYKPVIAERNEFIKDQFFHGWDINWFE